MLSLLKRLPLLFVLVFAFTGIAKAQTPQYSGAGSVYLSAGVPAGTCTQAALDVNTSNGNLYTCSGTAWTIVGTSGGTPCTLTALAMQYNNGGAFGCLQNVTYTAATGVLNDNQLANSNDTLYGIRFTDTSPTGNFVHYQNHAANADVYKLDVNGNIITAGAMNTNSSANVCGTAAPCIGGVEGTALSTPTASDDFLNMSSANHCIEASYNASALTCIPQSPASTVNTDLASFGGTKGAALLDTGIPSAQVTFCNATTAGSSCYWNGSAWALFAGNTGSAQCYSESAAGVPSWAACSGGGGGGSRIVSAQNATADTLSAAGSFATTYTIAANTITAGAPIHIIVRGIATSGSSPTLQLAIKFGSTTICNQASSLPFDNSDSNLSWSVHCDVIGVTTGTSGTVEAQGDMGGFTTSQNVLTFRGMPNTAVITVNTTTTNVVTVTATTLTNFTSVALRQLFVEIN